MAWSASNWSKFCDPKVNTEQNKSSFRTCFYCYKMCDLKFHWRLSNLPWPGTFALFRPWSCGPSSKSWLKQHLPIQYHVALQRPPPPPPHYYYQGQTLHHSPILRMTKMWWEKDKKWYHKSNALRIIVDWYALYYYYQLCRITSTVILLVTALHSSAPVTESRKNMNLWTLNILQSELCSVKHPCRGSRSMPNKCT